MAGKYRIAIIGSGTAGLASALFLERAGHRVSLFERFAEPSPVGAGLLLQPTGLACLACLGLDEQALAQAAPIRHLFGKDVNGKVVFDIHYGDLRSHIHGLGIHRGVLFSLLYDEVVKRGIDIETDCEITDTTLQRDRRIALDRRGESHGPFDLLVDASGMNSSLRAKHGQLRLHRPYPFGAAWGVLEDPEQRFCADRLQQRYDGAGIMIGMLAIGQRPVDRQRTAAFFWSLPTRDYQHWRSQPIERWKARVSGYWPELEALLTQFESFDDLTFSSYHDTIMQRWDYERLVFVGDAAHCTSPQLGQGANLALVDALTLADCLQQPLPLQQALQRYSKLRRKPVRFYQLASRLLTPFFQSNSRLAGMLRNRSFGLLCKTPIIKTQMLQTLAGIKTGVFSHANPGQWHAKYDLERGSGIECSSTAE